MKKRRSVSIVTLLMVMFMFVLSPISAKAETLGGYVRVEGLTNTIAEGKVNSDNALDALEHLLKEKNVPYNIQDGAYGKYIDSINNIKSASLGGYDGWMNVIKDGKSIVSPSVGLGSQNVKAGDTVIVYYGDYSKTVIINDVLFSPEIPKADKEFTITLNNKSLDYNTGKEVISPVKNVDVEIDGKQYKSNEKGEVKLSLAKGTHNYKFSGYSDGKSVPAVVMDKGIFILDEVNKPAIVYSDIKYNESVENNTAKQNYNIKEVYKNTLDFMAKQKVSNWSAFSLYKSGIKPDDSFLKEFSDNVKENLDDMSPTQLESGIIGLASAGYTPYNFMNHDIVEKLFNSDINNWLNNDVIFGLLTYKAANIDENYKITKSMLVNKLLNAYNDGWSWSGKGTDPDITAAAINSLAPYYNGEKAEGVDNAKVKEIVDKAVKVLSDRQMKDGNIASEWGASSDTNSFVIMGLTSIGIDPSKGMFAKENGNLVSALMSYRGNNGAFNHNDSMKDNLFSTEEALRALIALNDFEKNGKGDYYTSNLNLKSLKVYGETSKEYNKEPSQKEENKNQNTGSNTGNKTDNKVENTTNKDNTPAKEENKVTSGNLPKTGGVSAEALLLLAVISVASGVYLKKRA